MLAPLDLVSAETGSKPKGNGANLGFEAKLRGRGQRAAQQIQTRRVQTASREFFVDPTSSTQTVRCCRKRARWALRTLIPADRKRSGGFGYDGRKDWDQASLSLTDTRASCDASFYASRSPRTVM